MMNPRRFLPQAVLALLLFIFSLTLCAGSIGRIKGNVVDEKSGEPLYGVSVQIEGTTMGAKTNFDGDYLIVSVPPGTYNLVVTSIGYQSVKVTDVQVSTDQTTEIDIKMKQTALNTGKVIEVTGEKKGIDFLETGKPTIKTQAEILRKPAAEVGDILQRETGISREKEEDSRVRGGRTGEPVLLMDEAQYSAPLGGDKDASTGSGAEVLQHGIIACPKPVPQKPKCPPYPYWPPDTYQPRFDDMYFQNYGTNPFTDTRYDHLSTFAIDVDDASYVLTRSYLERGALPPADAIRVEEFVNHFDYGYESPRREPFAVYLEGAPSRFGRNTQLLRIGIKGREIAEQQRRPANLVFVIDVSGSMNRENRLGLVKNSLYYLVDQMEKHDQIGIVVFNTSGRVVLPMTSVRNRSQIYEAIRQLSTGGSTNAGEGLRLGYEMARRSFSEDRINRVIMCSDGVANTGTTDPDELLRKIKGYADMGITLSTVGVGMGNYNDVLLEQLGDKGNGNYSYIDDLQEAQRVFVENLSGTLEVIARDVKIQVNFDPEVVRSYRLLGFENRDVADHKFRDDREDGGEIGAGHEMTALYEIQMEPSRRSNRLGTISIRFKDADGYEVDEVACFIEPRVFNRRFDDCSPQFKLAAAAAEFAEIMKGSPWSRNSSLASVYRLGRDIANEWYSPEVGEFLKLVELADRHLGDHAER